MSVLSNPKHELTAQELAKGKTQVEAIEAAGYSPHRSNASRLIANDSIKLRVSELQEQAAMSISITLEGQIAKLEQVVEQATTLKQGSAAIAAIREQNELMGLKIQRVESKRVDAFANMSDEELEAYVNGDRSLEH
jgi:phage terminase small subunit